MPFFKKINFLFLLIFALSILLLPLFIHTAYYLFVMNVIGLNIIVVVGLNLFIGYAGQISLGHAAFYGIGAYTSAILTTTYGFHPWISIGLAMFLTGSFACIIGVPTLKLRGSYLVMATLGFNIIIHIIMVQWETVTGGPDGFPGIPFLTVGGFAFDTDVKLYYLVWLFSFLSILVSLNLVDSRVGRALRALRSSEITANTLGVNTDKYKIKVFVLSAMFTSVAGSLYAHYLTFISPKTFDMFYSIKVVIMVIVGGLGSIWGPLFGCALFTILSELLSSISETLNIITYGLILMFIMMFLPEGVIVGLVEHYQRRKVRMLIETEKAEASD
ncbi:MAG: branched-chain amino acid ABC transporter permease [Thermodesulfobacteriota bacterium]